MSISMENTPQVKYFESNSNPRLMGEGAEIPIFIGVSGNENPTTGIQKFKNFSECSRSISNGGIGTDLTNNPLLKVIQEFFEESRKISGSDVSVPYIYVIDLGNVDVTAAAPWTNAMELAKSKREITMEVYVGFKKTDTPSNVISILNSALTSIQTDNAHGNPRIIYTTILNTTDEELKKYTSDSESVYIQNSRVGLIAPDKWGKVLAKIAVTPYYEEPGFTDFRTINAGEFNERTPTQMYELQEAGIIFIADELAGSEVHPRINLAVSTAYAADEDARPNDCLLHSRRNVDQLIREVFVVLFQQIKRNETEINLSFCQTDVNVVVNEKIDAGYMMEGTSVNVVESDINPYHILAEGAAVPVNSTLMIGFSMFVDLPNVNNGGI